MRLTNDASHGYLFDARSVGDEKKTPAMGYACDSFVTGSVTQPCGTHSAHAGESTGSRAGAA